MIKKILNWLTEGKPLTLKEMLAQEKPSIFIPNISKHQGYSGEELKATLPNKTDQKVLETFFEQGKIFCLNYSVQNACVIGFEGEYFYIKDLGDCEVAFENNPLGFSDDELTFLNSDSELTEDDVKWIVETENEETLEIFQDDVQFSEEGIDWLEKGSVTFKTEKGETK